MQNYELSFDFPRFGDLPGSHLFNGSANKNDLAKATHGAPRVPGVLSRDNLNGVGGRTLASSKSSSSTPTGSVKFSGHSGTPGSNASVKSGVKPSSAPNQDVSTSDSPSSSSDSHHSQQLSSNGTSPEPSSHSPPNVKSNDSARGKTCSIHGTIDGEKSFCARLGMACGDINNPIPAAQDQKTKSNSVSSGGQPAPAPASVDDTVGFDWLAQQNGGQFDPVLFGDWREPQDAVLSQDFGSFFNDAFPLPDLGSPSHNLSELASTQPPKRDLMAQIDSKLDEEVVPSEDKSQMLTCTKIWYVPLSFG